MTQKQKASEPWIILPGTTVGGEVGTFSVDFIIWNRDRTMHRTLNGLVDTDKSYTLIPQAVLDELGIERRETRTFTLPDGSQQDLSLGWAEMELDGHPPVGIHIIFWTDDTVSVGSLALSTFALAADAKHRRLIPAELTL
jgi:hypothetical protein